MADQTKDQATTTATTDAPVTTDAPPTATTKATPAPVKPLARRAVVSAWQDHAGVLCERCQGREMDVMAASHITILAFSDPTAKDEKAKDVTTLNLCAGCAAIELQSYSNGRIGG